MRLCVCARVYLYAACRFLTLLFLSFSLSFLSKERELCVMRWRLSLLLCSIVPLRAAVVMCLYHLNTNCCTTETRTVA